uniref:Uncharacterized protein n=1 Tax=Rhizophora mucronata TaxID=61149 RepID=A0A2P2N719_RHIMU
MFNEKPDSIQLHNKTPIINNHDTARASFVYSRK